MKAHINTLLLAAAAIVSVLILSNTFLNRFRANDSIQVTGLGEKDFTSDLIVWSGAFSKKSMDLKSAYAALDADKEKIRDYLVSKGVQAGQIVFSSVDIHRQFDHRVDREGNRQSVFNGYNLTQRVEIESSEVDKVESLSREITELINLGVELYSNQPQYYYTQLAELKIEMVAAATQDATARAERIADNAEATLGELRKAQMGVFQIIGQHANEEYSWGGTFNTTSKHKTARITMKLRFGVD